MFVSYITQLYLNIFSFSSEGYKIVKQDKKYLFIYLFTFYKNNKFLLENKRCTQEKFIYILHIYEVCSKKGAFSNFVGFDFRFSNFLLFSFCYVGTHGSNRC